MQISKLNIIGVDVNELSPIYDQSGISTSLACKLLREILLNIYK
jgi:agmatinase